MRKAVLVLLLALMLVGCRSTQMVHGQEEVDNLIQQVEAGIDSFYDMEQ